MDVDYTYYEEFMGEPEIWFSTENKALVIWIGYFDDIMRQEKPGEDGCWHGLALHYNVYEEWSDGKWKMPDVKAALEEFRSLDISKFGLQGTDEAYEALCRFLKEAIENGEDVWMEEQ